MSSHLKQLMSSLVITLILVIPFGCSQPEDITIGAVLVLTTADGSAEGRSEDFLKGMELAAQTINGSGGINGRKVKLEYGDCQFDPVLGKKLFREIAAFSPPVIITMYSHISKAIVPLATELDIPQLVVMATAEDVMAGSTCSYRYFPNASDEAKASLALVRKLKVKRLGVINIDMEYGHSVSRELVSLLKKDGTDWEQIQYKELNDDLANKIKTLADCDAIQFTVFPGDIIGLATLIKKVLPGKPIIGPSSASSPQATMVPAFEGVYVPAPLIYNDSFPFALDVNRAFTEATGSPLNHYSALGYDSINLLAQLMKRKGVTPDDVKSELESGFIYPGLFGEVVKASGAKEFSFPLYPARVVNKTLIYQGK